MGRKREWSPPGRRVIRRGHPALSARRARRTTLLTFLMVAAVGFVPVARGKAPLVATVRGPGISGEVDLRAVMGDAHVSLLLPVARELAPPVAPLKTGASTGYTFTWYSVRNLPPEPGVDRAVYYRDAPGGPALQVIEVSELFVPPHALGWHRPDPATARALDTAIAAATGHGVRGATAYEFRPDEGERTGAWWVPARAASPVPEPLDLEMGADRYTEPLDLGMGPWLAAAVALLLIALVARRRSRDRRRLPAATAVSRSPNAT